MTVATRTTTVVPTTSGRLGQVTFFISELVSRKNSRVVSHHSRGFATIELSSLFATSVAMNHSPVCAECAVLGARVRSGAACAEHYSLRLAGQEGLEPTTCGFGDRCSAN